MSASHRRTLDIAALRRPLQALLIPTQLWFETLALSWLGVPVACGQFRLETVIVSAAFCTGGTNMRWQRMGSA